MQLLYEIKRLQSPAHSVEDSAITLRNRRAAVDSGRGVLLGVMDGVGSATRGGEAARFVASSLERMFNAVEKLSQESIAARIRSINQEIRAWGLEANRPAPAGAAAMTLACARDGPL